MSYQSDDTDVILAAYNDTIRDLFKVLFTGLVEASGESDKAMAEKRFTKGLVQARDARERALKAVTAS